jgi:hypothetical protein
VSERWYWIRFVVSLYVDGKRQAPSTLSFYASGASFREHYKAAFGEFRRIRPYLDPFDDYEVLRFDRFRCSYRYAKLEYESFHDDQRVHPTSRGITELTRR